MTFETFDQSDDLTKNTRNCIFKSALYESAFFENALPDLKSGLGIAFSKLCEFIPQSECCVFYLFLSGLIVGVQQWYNMHIKGPCTAGMDAPPRPAEKQAALPRPAKSRPCPAPPRGGRYGIFQKK